MPRIKRSVSSAPDQQAAAVYEGPDVPDGTYAGILRFMKYRESRQKKTPFWNTLVVLDSKDKGGSTAKYDGYAAFTEVYMIDGSEVNESREKSLYTAIAGKSDVEVITDDKVPGDPVVTKVGGVSPNGVRVYVQLKTERDDEYGARQRGVWIYPDPSFKRDGQPDVEAESDVDLDAEASAKPAAKKTAAKKTAAKKTATVTAIHESEPESETEVDYDAMTFPEARRKATELGISTEGVNKRDLIEQIKASVTGAAADGMKNPQDIHNMSDDELSEFLEQQKYAADDFEGMSRADTVEILKDDGVINPF
jgi:hypothetical protein